MHEIISMEVLKWIKEYKSVIKDFEIVLKVKYNISIEENIYNYIGELIAAKGDVSNYDYFFHGAGCRIIKENIICEYDFIPYENDRNYQFSLWKFKTFIESCYKIEIENDKLKEILEHLVKINKLNKLQVENRIFDIYII